MYHLLKKLSALTILTALMLSGSIPALAQETQDDDFVGPTISDELEFTILESKNSCHELGETFDALSKGTDTSTGKDPSYVAVEITEPIGAMEQKIESGDLTVSEVFWKFSCTVYKDNVTYKNLSETTKYYNEGDPKSDSENRKTVSIYRSYDKGCPADMVCTLVQVIRGTSGVGIIKTYVTIMYRWASSIVGIIAVLVIVISGIQISMDQGGGDGVTAAKTRIFQSITALTVLFLSALILYTINPTFFKR